MLADAGLLVINGTFLVEVLAFLVLLAILKKWAYPWIIKKSEERQDMIEEALTSAERMRAELDAALVSAKKELEEARQESRGILDHAKREALSDVDEIREKARNEAHADLQLARSEIGAERDRALQELRSQVGTLVVTAAGRVLGKAIDPATHERLIQESLRDVTVDNGSTN